MAALVKICGITERATLDVLARAGVAFAGFVHFARSPRHLSPDRLTDLTKQAPAGLCKVLLTVNPSDDLLDTLLTHAPIDMLQLHGSESPERVTALRARYGLPVMKAVGVRDAQDLAAVVAYGKVADQLLIDAKPPEGALPGGNGLSFDWDLIARQKFAVPWMLAGGLTAANVAAAITCTGAQMVDLSSGVESRPGVKDPALIEAFCAAAHAQTMDAPPRLR